MPKTALSIVHAAARSPARQAFIDQTDEVSRLAEEMDSLLAQANAARQADGDIANAEVALKDAAFEALLSPAGELSKTERARLVETVREARGRQGDCRAQEARHGVLAPQHATAQAKRREALHAILSEEGQRLAEFYQAHGRAALNAQKAIEALAQWAAYQGEDAALANRLRSALKPHPEVTDADPGAFSRSVAALDASVDAYVARWLALPALLESDPDASIAEPAL